MRLKRWKAIQWSDNLKYKICVVKIKAVDYNTTLLIAKAIFDRAGMPGNIEVKRLLLGIFPLKSLYRRLKDR